MQLEGTWKHLTNPQMNYTYNNKEWENDLGLGWLFFGARHLDPATGRFTSIDRFADKFAFQSPFAMAANNPVIFMDVNGDSAWVTSHTYDLHGKSVTDYTIHVTGKVLDLSGVNASKVAEGINKFYNRLGGGWFDSNKNRFNISFNMNFQVANSMDDVLESDHLLVVVDKVLGKTDPELGGGEAGGYASMPGKIGYIEYGKVKGMIDVGIHEFGHNMGLGHVKNGTNNIMSYDDNATSFTINQLQDMLFTAMDGTANNGSNRQISNVTTNNWFYNTSTNEQPWYKNTKTGQVIPRILINPIK